MPLKKFMSYLCKTNWHEGMEIAQAIQGGKLMESWTIFSPWLSKGSLALTHNKQVKKEKTESHASDVYCLDMEVARI